MKNRDTNNIGNIKWILAKDMITVSLIFTILVFLLLLLFQPFEYRYYTLAKIVQDSLLSGFIVFITTFTTRFLLLYKNNKDLRTKSDSYRIHFINAFFDILLFLLLTFFINLILGGFKNIGYIKWFSTSLKYILIFEIVLIPLSLFVQRYLFLSSTLNKKNDSSFFNKEQLEPITDKVFLVSESGNEKLDLLPQDIIMIKSSSNYVEVVYLKDDEISYTLLRSRLASIYDRLKDCPFLFRCHRSYVINTNKVEKTKGNSRGYLLTLKGLSNTIPVSRSKISAFNNITNLDQK